MVTQGAGAGQAARAAGPGALQLKWEGESFMAIGMQDTGFGKPVMDELPTVIRGCPEALELPHAGRFVQEAGEDVGMTALASEPARAELDDTVRCNMPTGGGRRPASRRRLPLHGG